MVGEKHYCSPSCETMDLLDGTGIPVCGCGNDGAPGVCPFDLEIKRVERTCVCCLVCRRKCELDI